jgi:hypothetical protein
MMRSKPLDFIKASFLRALSEEKQHPLKIMSAFFVARCYS